jgi:beta-galactosidase/evolved beta-galactosidase subunit alpha
MYPHVRECESICSGKGPNRADWMPDYDRLVREVNARPFMLCEYAIAMGNGPGGLREYWDIIWKYPKCAGAFIWQLMDLCLRAKIPPPPSPSRGCGGSAPDRLPADGRTFFAYGGDFGDTPNDGSFLCDGVLFPDRTPSPTLAELKQALQPVSTELDDAATLRLRLTNRLAFTGLDFLTAHWTLLADGDVIQSGALKLPAIAPYESDCVKVPCVLPADETRELWLVVSYRLAASSKWADAGHEVGFAQFRLRAAVPRPAFIANMPPVAVSESGWKGRYFAWTGTDFSLTYDAARGIISNWTDGGRPILERGPILNFWRAPTVNDGKEIGGHAQATWRAHGLHDLKPRFGEPRIAKSRKDGPSLIVPVHLGGPVVACGIDAEMRYAVDSHGRLAVTISGHPTGEWTCTWPRIGIELRLPLADSRCEWYGRGPGETYVDTCAAGRIGIWRDATDALHTPYVVPQENGSHFDTREVRFADNLGRGLRIVADKPFCFGVSRYETKNITEALHTTDLVPCDYYVLSLDIAQDGIGTASCGPGPLPQYVLHPQAFSFTWVLEPTS